MSYEKKTTQYAIEVPDRGFIDWQGGVTAELDMAWLQNFESAADALERSRNEYIRMGCPEIASTLRIIARTATLTYSDWGVPVPIVRKGVDAL